jgi:hypothetical protein
MANQLDENSITAKPLDYVFYILTFWSSLILLGLYFANNTLYLDKVGGVSLGLLVVIFVAFALESLFIFIKKKKDNIFINKSLFLFILLIIYISLRIVTDISEIDYLRSFWFSTTLGCLIFYMLGAFIACVTKEINIWCNKNKYLSRYNYYLGFFYILCNFLLNLYVFLKLLPRRRPVFFLIDTFGFYQRPGNFIIINSFLIAYCYFNIQSNNKRKFLLDIFCFSYFIITIFLVQFVGSNNGFLGVFGILFISIVYKFYLLKENKNEQKLFVSEDKPKTINKCLLISFKKLGLISVCLFIILFLFFTAFRSIMPPIRILHYNLNEEYNPLDDRLTMLKENFLPQLSVSPLMGNMDADNIISGKGTYVHSFILSMMTHIGIVGVTLFLLYFFFAMFEYYKSLHYIKDYKSFYLKLFVFLITIFIFLMSNIASFFSWNPIWFALGFCFPAIYYRNNSIKDDCTKLEGR